MTELEPWLASTIVFRMKLLFAARIVVTLASTLTPAMAVPAGQCFFANQFENWRAPDPMTIYIRIIANHYYRLDLASRCTPLAWPDARLISRFRGSDTICSATDWDLEVAGMGDIHEPCFAKSMTLLSPAEADAIPSNSNPDFV